MGNHAETVAAQELEIASLGCEIERLVAERDGLRARVEQLEAALPGADAMADILEHLSRDRSVRMSDIRAVVVAWREKRAALSGLGDAG